jgi:hypothetical protein
MAKDKDVTKAKDVLNKNNIEHLVGRKIVKENKILCIILHEGRGSTWYLLNDKADRFCVAGNTYFKVDATYVKGSVRFMIYIEGYSLPIDHGCIEREEVIKEITDPVTQKVKKYLIQKIKGLKFDSKLIDILLNRHLADEFTKQHMDLPNLVIVILLVVGVIIGFVNVGLHFA